MTRHAPNMTFGRGHSTALMLHCITFARVSKVKLRKGEKGSVAKTQRVREICSKMQVTRFLVVQEKDW